MEKEKETLESSEAQDELKELDNGWFQKDI